MCNVPGATRYVPMWLGGHARRVPSHAPSSWLSSGVLTNSGPVASGRTKGSQTPISNQFKAVGVFIDPSGPRPLQEKGAQTASPGKSPMCRESLVASPQWPQHKSRASLLAFASITTPHTTQRHTTPHHTTPHHTTPHHTTPHHTPNQQTSRNVHHGLCIRRLRRKVQSK